MEVDVCDKPAGRSVRIRKTKVCWHFLFKKVVNFC